MDISCFCDKCVKEMRYGIIPYKHYIPTRLTHLEKNIFKLRASGKMKFLGGGRHRDVYLTPSGKHVIKFPCSYDGIMANTSERDVYLGNIDISKIESSWSSTDADLTFPKRENLAGCRMIGRALLLMSKIDTSNITEKFIDYHAPSWVHSIDCEQVGYHKDGRLVAFDYSAF